MAVTCYPVNVTWRGLKLRLWPDRASADENRALIARDNLQRYDLEMHESGNGWWIKDRESGRHYDAAGMVETGRVSQAPQGASS